MLVAVDVLSLVGGAGAIILGGVVATAGGWWQSRQNARQAIAVSLLQPRLEAMTKFHAQCQLPIDNFWVTERYGEPPGYEKGPEPEGWEIWESYTEVLTQLHLWASKSTYKAGREVVEALVKLVLEPTIENAEMASQKLSLYVKAMRDDLGFKADDVGDPFAP